MAQPMTRRVKDIQNRNEIEPALAGEDARGIGDPDLIGSLSVKLSDAVGGNRSTMTAVCGAEAIFGALPREEPLQTHQPSNAIASSRAAQRTCQSRAAVGLTTAHKLLANALAQPGVLHLARPRVTTTLDPSVVSTARDQKSLTQPSCLVLAAHLLDSGIPLGGASERMPSDFFKTSRCSKSFAFSARKRRFSTSSSSRLRFGVRPVFGALGTRSACAQR